jgi:hypothetical protein
MLRGKGIELGKIHSLCELFPEFRGTLDLNLPFTMQIVLLIRVSYTWQLLRMLRNMFQFNVLLNFARNFLHCPSASINVVFLQCSVFNRTSKKLEKGSCFSSQPRILLIFWLIPPFRQFSMISAAEAMSLCWWFSEWTAFIEMLKKV